MLTVEKIDWNLLWRDERSNPGKVRDRDYWNKRAPTFADHTRSEGYDDYVEPLLKIITPQPQWSVLDVGCGAGTIAHPIARLVSQVTAIDFSPVMVDLLKQHSEKLGIRNIDARVLGWEDDWSAAGIPMHDVAIASRSLIVEDARAMLTKLSSFARERVIVTCPVGNGPGDSRVLEAVGREASVNPDYIYICNLLHQMGVYANVAILERGVRWYPSRQAAAETLRWIVEPMTPAEELAYSRFIDNHLIEAESGWRIQGERQAHWAVLSWKASALHAAQPV
jgi:SAM-dependent methyltransferase